jgi:hypothetical protein
MWYRISQKTGFSILDYTSKLPFDKFRTFEEWVEVYNKTGGIALSPTAYSKVKKAFDAAKGFAYYVPEGASQVSKFAALGAKLAPVMSFLEKAATKLGPLGYVNLANAVGIILRKALTGEKPEYEDVLYVATACMQIPPVAAMAGPAGPIIAAAGVTLDLGIRGAKLLANATTPNAANPSFSKLPDSPYAKQAPLTLEQLKLSHPDVYNALIDRKGQAQALQYSGGKAGNSQAPLDTNVSKSDPNYAQKNLLYLQFVQNNIFPKDNTKVVMPKKREPKPEPYYGF